MDKDIKRAEQILHSHGIEMKIGGCGCCDSPWIEMHYQGELIVKSEGSSLDNTALAEIDRCIRAGEMPPGG